MKILFTITLVLFTSIIQAQELPYYEIPTPAQEYTGGTVVSRMMDGLGFRYYWATKGLTEKDLAYQPNNKGRSTQATVNHLYDLSNMMLRLTKIEIKQVKKKDKMTFTEMRTQTLNNFKELSNRFRRSKDLSEFNTIKEGKVIIPFFNIINGPIADAIWHTGQVASFRRSSGNPINSKINHFSGTVKK